MIFIFFLLTPLCIVGSGFIHLIRTDSIPFYDWVIFHYVHVPQLLYSFFWQWTSRLLPCSGCYKVLQWTLGCRCLFEVYFSQGICPLVGLLADRIILSFLRKRYTVFHSICTNLYSHQWCRSVAFSPHPSTGFIVCRFFVDGHSDQFEVMYSVLICISVIISDVEHLFMCLLAICISFLEKCLGLLPSFWLG